MIIHSFVNRLGERCLLNICIHTLCSVLFSSRSRIQSSLVSCVFRIEPRDFTPGHFKHTLFRSFAYTHKFTTYSFCFLIQTCSWWCLECPTISFSEECWHHATGQDLSQQYRHPPTPVLQIWRHQRAPVQRDVTGWIWYKIFRVLKHFLSKTS